MPAQFFLLVRHKCSQKTFSVFALTANPVPVSVCPPHTPNDCIFPSTCVCNYQCVCIFFSICLHPIPAYPLSCLQHHNIMTAHYFLFVRYWLMPAFLSYLLNHSLYLFAPRPPRVCICFLSVFAISQCLHNPRSMFYNPLCCCTSCTSLCLPPNY